MKDRIDPLIAERAPWLFNPRFGTATVKRAMDHALGYRKTLEIAEMVKDMPSSKLMGVMGEMLAHHVQASGLGNIPRHGPALIVANHPTGIADGIILHHLVAKLRPDLYFFANADILRVLPQMADMIAPVEWRHDLRTHAKTRATMAYVRAATEAGRLGVIFPSGRLAKRRWLKLHERPWMASAAMLARKFDLPVIPVNLQARNSVLFYLFDRIHPTLRDVTLFHETLNKDSQPYTVTVGEPIAARALPQGSDEGIEMLRRATLALGGKDAPSVSLLRASRRPLLKS